MPRAQFIHRKKKKGRFARSARTQRSVRSTRLELRRTRAGVAGNYGVVRKMHLVQCCTDSVKHGTSPSRRDTSRRVIHVASDKLQSAAAKHRNVRRRYAAYLSSFSSKPDRTSFNPTAGFAFPAALVRCIFLSRSARSAPGRNLDRGQPFSYCYEFTNPAPLGKRRYVHTAADLHVRSESSNRAGLENR
jgi:hypothetical protein